MKKQLEETDAAGKHIKIQWIPDNEGITWNEKADKLAR
jgi:ribonuclease HI